MPAPSDAFPDGLAEAPLSRTPDEVQRLIDLALRRRADYLSAEKKFDAAEVLRRDGQSPPLAVRPRDEQGLSSLQPGSGAGDFLVRPSRTPAAATLRGRAVDAPMANTAALGEVAEAEAAYQQAMWLRTERARVIAADVTNAVTALQTAFLRLGDATAAVSGFRAALDGEQDKLRLGLGSITDLLTVEGRLNDALQELVGAQQAYAVGVVQLRYASGTLVDAVDLRPPAPDVFFRPLAGTGGPESEAPVDASKIFRKVALERMSSPEQLDQLLRVTTPKSWLALLSLIALLAVAVAWGYCRRLTTRVSGQGVLIRAGGVRNVVPLGAGQVLDIHVRVGDKVAVGQVIGTVAQPALVEKIRVARSRLAEATRSATRCSRCAPAEVACSWRS